MARLGARLLLCLLWGGAARAQPLQPELGAGAIEQPAGHQSGRLSPDAITGAAQLIADDAPAVLPDAAMSGPAVAAPAAGVAEAGSGAANRPAEAVAPTGSPRQSLLAPRFGGFAHADYLLTITDGAARTVATLGAREVELNVMARHGAQGGVRLDLNLVAAQGVGWGALASTLEALIEQAYVEWTPGRFAVRLGRINAPLGLEPLDASERVTLSRATASRLASPDLLTAALASAQLIDGVALEALVSTGWDRLVDNNRAKTVGLVVPHRVGDYEARLGGLLGIERPGVDDWRYLIDYAGTLRLSASWQAGFELLVGAEQGLGLSPRTGMLDPVSPALWYGGIAQLTFEGQDDLAPLTAALRFEYLRDPDLVLGLPGQAPQPLTTLLGSTLTARYALVPGVAVGAEYRADCARGDERNVSIFRNYDAFPQFWNVARWFVTQEVRVAIVAQF